MTLDEITGIDKELIAARYELPHIHQSAGPSYLVGLLDFRPFISVIGSPPSPPVPEAEPIANREPWPNL
jgi:hypothetical protein